LSDLNKETTYLLT